MILYYVHTKALSIVVGTSLTHGTEQLLGSACENIMPKNEPKHVSLSPLTPHRASPHTHTHPLSCCHHPHNTLECTNFPSNRFPIYRNGFHEKNPQQRNSHSRIPPNICFTTECSLSRLTSASCSYTAGLLCSSQRCSWRRETWRAHQQTIPHHIYMCTTFE